MKPRWTSGSSDEEKEDVTPPHEKQIEVCHTNKASRARRDQEKKTASRARRGQEKKAAPKAHSSQEKKSGWTSGSSSEDSSDEEEEEENNEQFKEVKHIVFKHIPTYSSGKQRIGRRRD